MVALAADHRSIHLRRWMISAAIVVLAHAGIAAAVLTWRTFNGSLETQTPIEIRLTPEPIAPPLVATAPPAATPAPQTAKAPPEASAPSKREGPIESLPSERLPGTTSPVIVTPEDRAQREHESLYADQGPSRGGQANPLSGPIDTTLANPNLRPNIRGPSNDWRKVLLTHRRPVGASAPTGPRGPRVVNGPGTRNAIGVLEPGTRDTAISPLRIPAQNAGVPGATGHTVTNGLGTTVDGANRQSPNIAPYMQTMPGGLTGTGMTRQGLGISSVGGAAKTGTTGLNGSSFRPK
jgi:hypothetical protein